jgi:hypothetical protein
MLTTGKLGVALWMADGSTVLSTSPASTGFGRHGTVKWRDSGDGRQFYTVASNFSRPTQFGWTQLGTTQSDVDRRSV